MIIATNFPDELEPGYLAWFVAKVLTGIAIGVYPSFLRWNLPPLYESGVRYQLEPGHGSGKEDFALPLTAFRRKWADCDDLSVWAACEWWKTHGLHPKQVSKAVGAGAAAKPWVEWRGESLHAVLWLPGGEIEDPSRVLADMHHGSR